MKPEYQHKLGHAFELVLDRVTIIHSNNQVPINELTACTYMEGLVEGLYHEIQKDNMKAKRKDLVEIAATAILALVEFH